MKNGDFLPCPKRTRLVMFEADGSKDHVFRCTEQDAPAANTDVTPEVCSECPVRQLLMSTEYVPPTRKVHEEAKPDKGGDGFVPCVHRGVVTVQACCGATKRVRVCQHADCQYFQGEVDRRICANCPARQAY